MKLEGKVVIVAGAGPGIGEGTVKVLASEGADIAVVDINEAEAKRIAEGVKKAGRKAVAIKADLQDDGELLGESPASFWVIPSALTVVV